MGLLKRKSKGDGDVVVGLDLDPSHIAAAEVVVNGSVTVKRGAVMTLRPGILRDGEIGDAAGLTEALREMWAEHKFPERVRLGLANQRIVVRTLDLPPLDDEKAIAAAVRVEAPDHIPMPMEEAVLDFQSLGHVQTPEGPRTRVVVVAVRREMVERYAEAVRAAGLKVEGIDLSAFALVRALNRHSAAAGGLLYINVSGLTNVAVASEGHVLFTRAAAGGLESMIHTLSTRRSLTLEHAAQWLNHVGLATPLESVEGDPEVVAAARAVLEEGVHQLADTVRNSLNFYRMQESAETVGSAVLAGPAVDIPGFAEALADSLRMPVEPAVVAGEGLNGSASRLAVAAGLAIEAV
jgi:type IV pilus assembly protein PilM